MAEAALNSGRTQIWTVLAALDWTRGYLERHADEHPRRSAEWLLEATTGLSRLELYTCFDKPLSQEERTQLRDGVARRAAGEPLQYITGTAPFRHLEVKVTPDVLIPRPETEVLVDLALAELVQEGRGSRGAVARLWGPDSASGFSSSPLKTVSENPFSEARALSSDPTASSPHSGDRTPTPPQPKALDLCTGSGCVALSLITEAGLSVVATDVSAAALAVAADNAAALGCAESLDLRQGDLFEALGEDERFDLIVSNPPYVPRTDMDALPKEVADFEPGLALDGGPDGLDYFRRIIACAPRHLTGNGVIIVELAEGTAMRAAAEAVKLDVYEVVDVLPDLTGRQRFVRLRQKASE